MQRRFTHRLAHLIPMGFVIAALTASGASVGRTSAQATPEATGPIAIVSPASGEELVGRDVAVSWEAPGLTIVAAAKAKQPTDLHAHFIVDGAYDVVEGAPLPQQCGILHTAANPVTLVNLSPGEHTVQMVIADPGHVPVAELDRPSVTFTVAEDPDAIRITTPEQCDEVSGPDVDIAWEAPGLTIVAASEATAETDLHAHFIIDGAYDVAEDLPIPMQDGIVHTAANPVTIEGLAPGQHTVQLVIANPGHVPVPDLARPTVTFIVTEPEAPATPVASTGAASGSSMTT